LHLDDGVKHSSPRRDRHPIASLASFTRFSRMTTPIRALFPLLFSCFVIHTLPAAESRPNIILVVADNLGTGDLGCYGSKLHRTPNLDRMAAEGMRFTSFYVTSGVCTPSRASIMTGAYAQRVSLHVSDTGGAVLQPVAARGLHPDEATTAEVLRPRGYSTACIGKWHLGDQPPFLPTSQGFDEFFGIPYSEDMVQEKRPDEWPPLPLMRGTEVIDAPVDCEKLTRIYTEAAVDFIRRSKDKPFFLYFPEARPGSTSVVHVGNEFRGKSANGLYGDSVEELDWSLGEVLDAVKEQGLDERTLVIWTSDNGAVRRNPAQGSNAPYQGMGYSTTEGGMRMPCLMRWPGKIPAGRVCDEICSSLDFLPTMAALVGASPDPARKIDGYDASDLWLGKDGAKSRYDESGFFFYHMSQLQAVRRGPWKLYLPIDKALVLGAKKPQSQAQRLFDVRNDVSEQHEASAEQPEVVKSLLALAEGARQDLGDVDKPGKGQREPGRVTNPTGRTRK
jgi:arylsulfatase A